MTYKSFDPRINIRNKIGYSIDFNHDDVDESTISVTDSYSDTVFLPLLMPSEVRTSELYPMPFIEMTLVSSPCFLHNIGGDIREQEAYIDFNIYYTDTDNIDATSFGKTVADELVLQLMTYKNSVSTVSELEPVDDGREIIETDGTGKQVVFHRIVKVKCKNWDNR